MKRKERNVTKGEGIRENVTEGNETEGKGKKAKVMKDKTRQHKTRQDNARHHKATQDKTMQGTTRHHKTRQYIRAVVQSKNKVKAHRLHIPAFAIPLSAFLHFVSSW